MTDVGVADEDRLIRPLPQLARRVDSPDAPAPYAVDEGCAAAFLVKGHGVLVADIDLSRSALPEVLLDTVADAPFDRTVALNCHTQRVACPPADGLAADHEGAVPHFIRTREAVHICSHHARESVGRRKIRARQDLDIVAVFRKPSFHAPVFFQNLWRSMEQCCMSLARLVMDARDNADRPLDGHILRRKIRDADEVRTGTLEAMTERHTAPLVRGKAEVLHRHSRTVHHERDLHIGGTIQMVRHLRACKEAVNIRTGSNLKEEMCV